MKYLLILVAIVTNITCFAQGKGKGKMKGKAKHEQVVVSSSRRANNGQSNKTKNDNADYNRIIWGGTNYTQGKISKNQPAKVREAFARDYPYAGNVTWTKYRGDWTATFGSGIFGSKTAVYHANGQRKDLRSVINRNQLGNGSMWDQIFKSNNISGNQVVQIERPGIPERIFRVGTGNQYYYYNQDGQVKKYDY